MANLSANIRTFSEPRTWIMADPHFGQTLGPSSWRKGFSSTEEMDEKLRQNLKVVGEKDTLIMIGDISMSHDPAQYMKSLRGKHVILISGNHDKQTIKNHQRWTDIFDYLEANFMLEDGRKQRVVLSHYPMMSWNGARTSIHLYGHVHGLYPPMATEKGGRMDVGADVWDFKPVRLRDVIATLDKVRQDGFALPGKDF